MPFQPIKYNSGANVFNVKIEDPNGKVVEKWKFMSCDFVKWASLIVQKYGLKIRDRDLDWVKYT